MRAGARERAGFMEAPQMGPAKRASRAMTPWVMTPCETSLTMIAPVPAKTRMAVAMASAAYLFMWRPWGDGAVRRLERSAASLAASAPGLGLVCLVSSEAFGKGLDPGF